MYFSLSISCSRIPLYRRQELFSIIPLSLPMYGLPLIAYLAFLTFSSKIVIGIKEPPLSSLTTWLSSPISNGGRAYKIPRTHLMFSHTTKGQTYNLPLLSAFLTPDSPRLIDYELLTDKLTGKRSIGFGFFAGVAGTLEGFIASGIDLLHMEISS